MTLTLDDLENGNIYYDNFTLSERIDFSWSIYNDESRKNETKERALKFLIYAFDLNRIENVNEQLILLMHERDEHKQNNPEYIPGKSPKSIALSSDEKNIHKPEKYGNHKENVNKLIKKKEILDIDKYYFHMDKILNLNYLNNKERSIHRVNIEKGLFKKNGEFFDTSEMISHKKIGFAAITLNLNGELSLFNHEEDPSKFLHSSMNAGAPVFFAGEIKINHGKLEAITMHSGHYKPTLFNVYRLLEHFVTNNIDISKAKIITQNNISCYIPSLELKKMANHKKLYEMPALKLYNIINDHLSDNINCINKDIKVYNSFGLKKILFKIKDFILKSNLTEERMKISNEISTKIKEIKNNLHDQSHDQIKNQVKDFNNFLIDIESKNNKLSNKYNKKEDSGMLSKKIKDFKNSIQNINFSENENTENSKLENIMKKLC